MVSIDTMNKQVNVRLSDELLTEAKEYAKAHGYGTVQDLMKEMLREKVFGTESITRKEAILVNKVLEYSEKQNAYGTEEELMIALDKK